MEGMRPDRQLDLLAETASELQMSERYRSIVEQSGAGRADSVGFEHLWRAISEYFIHCGSHSPATLTEETMERMAQQVRSGQRRPTPHDFYRVARLVWKEHCRYLMERDDSRKVATSNF
jgi:hypothetical protein